MTSVHTCGTPDRDHDSGYHTPAVHARPNLLARTGCGHQHKVRAMRTVLAQRLWQIPQLNQLIELDPDHEIFPEL
jgi:hypothetical protein